MSGEALRRRVKDLEGQLRSSEERSKSQMMEAAKEEQNLKMKLKDAEQQREGLKECLKKRTQELAEAVARMDDLYRVIKQNSQ